MPLKVLKNSSGKFVEETALTASTGVADKLISTDANGKIDASFMPSGLGADTLIVVASEALAAGDFVNIYDNAGTPNCRKADATNPNKEASGYVLAAVLSGANATVSFDDTNTGQTGLTAGALFLSAATPGKATATVPTTAGHIVQRLGTAVSATAIHVNLGPAITLA